MELRDRRLTLAIRDLLRRFRGEERSCRAGQPSSSPAGPAEQVCFPQKRCLCQISGALEAEEEGKRRMKLQKDDA